MPTDIAATTAPSSPVLEAPLPREVLSHLYATMLRARHVGTRLRTAHVPEAILAGTLQNVAGNDTLVSAPSNPVLEVLRGTPLSTVLALARGKESKDGLQELKVIAAGPETLCSFAAGFAFAKRRVHSDSVVIAFASGKLSRTSTFEQSIKFAGENRVPLVLIADSTESRTSSRNHDGALLSHWPCPTIAVDGRDVIAVYRVTKEAINAARRGHGPTLIDCVNFLAPGRRGRDERDPLKSFRAYLERHNAWSDSWHSELVSTVKAEIAASSRNSNHKR